MHGPCSPCRRKGTGRALAAALQATATSAWRGELVSPLLWTALTADCACLRYKYITAGFLLPCRPCSPAGAEGLSQADGRGAPAHAANAEHALHLHQGAYDGEWMSRTRRG